MSKKSILLIDFNPENPKNAEYLKNWYEHFDLEVRIPSYPSLFPQYFLH